MKLNWAPRTRSPRVLWLLEEICHPYGYVTAALEQGLADGLLGTDNAFGLKMMRVLEPRPLLTGSLDRCAARPAHVRALAIDAAA